MSWKRQKGDMSHAATSDSSQRCRLWGLLLASIGITLRDLQLAAYGGGITPRWMLRVETASFAACALAGSCALTSRRQSAAAERATVLFGLLGAAVHGTRLTLFLMRSRPAAG